MSLFKVILPLRTTLFISGYAGTDLSHPDSKIKLFRAIRSSVVTFTLVSSQ